MSWNQDCSCFAACSARGFSVYNTEPFKQQVTAVDHLARGPSCRSGSSSGAARPWLNHIPGAAAAPAVAPRTTREFTAAASARTIRP